MKELFNKIPQQYILLIIVLLVILTSIIIVGLIVSTRGIPQNQTTSWIYTRSHPPSYQDPIYDFELELYGNGKYRKGTLIRLSDFYGQPVVMNFWYPSCPPCRVEINDLEISHRRYKDEGLQFIGIQSLMLDSADEGEMFIRERRVTYAIGPDKGMDISTDYSIISYPTTIFLDDNHRIVRIWTGLITSKELDGMIALLLKY